jgi:hypothetical protein
VDTSVGAAGAASGSAGSANPLLVFLHLPKTGGTSLQEIFQGRLMDGRPFFHIGNPDHVRAFLALPEAQQKRYYGAQGHMPMGLHAHITRPVTYLTFLRNPVERVLSSYAMALRYAHHPGHAEMRDLGIAWAAPAEGNAMVARLSDHDLFQAPIEEDGGRFWVHVPVTREHLEQAKANLAKCAFIGLHEHFEQDIRALRTLPSHRIFVPAVLPHSQKGANRKTQADFTKAEIDLIREHSALDQELYDYAVQLRAEAGGPVRTA